MTGDVDGVNVRGYVDSVNRLGSTTHGRGTGRCPSPNRCPSPMSATGQMYITEQVSVAEPMSVAAQASGLLRATRTPLAMAVVLVAVSWLVFPASASAQGRDGFYLRGDFGDSDALTMRARIEGIDQPTRCDRLLHPDPATVPRDPACSGSASGAFATVEFDRGAETMTSATALAVGYARGRLRVEAELSNTMLGGTSAPMLDAGQPGEERLHEWSAVERPHARVSGFSINDLFLNVHLDFSNSVALHTVPGRRGRHLHRHSHVRGPARPAHARRRVRAHRRRGPGCGRRRSRMADACGRHGRPHVAPSG